jgi:hypothetical protein
MLYNLEDIKDTLEDFTCKDVVNIITSYAFERCWVCNKIDIYDVFIHFCINKDNPLICYECYCIKDRCGDVYKCKRKGCSHNFLRSQNKFCRSCYSECKIYCPICLSDIN